MTAFYDMTPCGQWRENKHIAPLLLFFFFNGATDPKAVFLNRLAATRYRALASIIPGRERPEEIAIFYKISLVQLIINLNVILYLST